MAEGSRGEPRVPYSGEQQIAPSTAAPNDFLSVRANPNTFGAQIGEAFQKAGQGLSQLSEGELNIWKTLQGIKNEADSTNADSQYQVTSGKVMNDFRNLPASEQISQHDQYVDQLVKARNDIRSNLDNPAAQRAFDQLTLRSQGYMIRDVGTLAAQSHKTLLKQATTDSINVAIDQASRPEIAFDPQRADDQLVGIRLQIPALVAMDDVDIGKAGATIDPKTGIATFPDTPEGNQARAIYQNTYDKAVGQFWKNRIETLANDPEKGSPSLAEKTLLDNKDKIPSQTYAELSHQLFAAVRNENTRDFSDDYTAHINSDYSKSAGDPGASALGGFDERGAELGINKIFPDSIITSEKRSPEHNAKVNGKPNSMHLTGQAMDFSVPTDDHGNRLSLNEIRYRLRQEGLPVTELLPEKGPHPSDIQNADHIHWGWGSKTPGKTQEDTNTPPSFVSKEQYLLLHRSELIDDSLAKAKQDHPNWGATELDMVRSRVTANIDQQITQQTGMDKADRATISNWAVKNNQTSLDQISSAPSDVQSAYQRLMGNDAWFLQTFSNKLVKANSAGQSPYYGTEYYNLLTRVLTGQIHDVGQLPNVGVGKDAVLTNTGVQSLLQTIKDSSTPEGEAWNLSTLSFFKKARGLVTGTGSIPGVKTQELDEKFNKWLQFVLPKIAAGKAQGKSPDTLFDEKSADFVGWPSATDPQQLMKETMNHRMNQLREPPKPFDIKSITTPEALMNAARDKHVTREQFRAIAKSHNWFTGTSLQTKGPNALND